MTYFSAIPVPETTVGLAFETERGVAVAPEYWVPVMGPKYKPDLKLLPDEGLRGSMVSIYDEVPSLRYDSHGWDQYPYLDSLPVEIKALLGSSDSKTAAITTTETVAEALKGATHIISKKEIAVGAYITIGSGANLETHRVTEKHEVASEEWETTFLYPLAFTHVTKSAIKGLTSHAFSLLNNSPSTGNQPQSLTITDFAGEKHWRQMTAAQLSSLAFSGGAEVLPKVVTEWFANAAVTPSEPSPSFTSVEAPPGWTVQCSIGGTVVGYLVDWSFEFKRNVKPVPAITGTQAYYQYMANALDPTAKITVLEDPEATWLTAYEEGALESIDLTLIESAEGSAVNFHSTKAKFTSGELDRSKEWVEVPLEVQLLPSATDALAGGVSPVEITVANKVTAEYA